MIKILALCTGSLELPDILRNASVMRESLAVLRRRRDQAAAMLFYGHDPAQWAATPRAPASVV
jgi:hypothetical protein